MRLVFQKLHIENFLSFVEADIEIDNKGFVKVIGKNENIKDNSFSNGAGKSGIWEALLWAITGETLRNTKDIINKNGIDGVLVELILKIDTDEIKITRTKNHSKYGTDLRVYKNNQIISGKGVRDSEKILSNIMNDIDIDLLSAVVVLGQGLPKKFTGNSPSGRKEILENLTKSDFMIEDLKSRVTSRQQSLSEQLRIEERKIIEINKEQEILEKQKINLEKQLNTDADELKSVVVQLQEDKRVIDDEFCKIESNLESTKNKINEITEKRAEIKELGTKDIEDIGKSRKLEFEPLDTKINDFEASKKVLEKTIKEKKSIKDICPTCNQKIKGVVKPSTEQEEKELSEIEEKLKAEKDKWQEIHERYNIKEQETREKYNNQYAELTAQIKERQKEQESLSAKVKQLKEKQIAINEKLFEKEKELSLCESEISTAQKQYKDILEQEEKNKEIINKLSEEKTDTEQRQTYIKQFSTALSRDFRGYLLKDIVAYIDKNLKKYAKVVYNSDNIEFTLNGNNISIQSNGKEYESLSSGEKQKVDIMIQFALREMLCELVGFSCNMVVLDEVFDGLDSKGCDKIIDLIGECLADVSSVYIVTHRQDLAIPYDSEIIVNKDRYGISKLLC